MTRSSVRTFDGAIVAGWHELAVTKRVGRPARELLATAVSAAIAHAGLTPADIDGFAVGGFTLAPDHAVDLAARSGLRVGWLAPQDPGGPGAINALLQAASAVLHGDATAVVCAAADTTDAVALATVNANFSTTFAETLTPIGAGAATVVFGLLQEEHRARTGSTRDDLGRIAVAQRRNGTRNAHALFRTPLTVAEYLASPPIVEPLHLLDCVFPGSGAAAFVVTTRETLGARARQAVRVDAGFTEHGGARPSQLDFGWSRHSAALYDAAGRGPRDLSLLELYDDFPLMVAVQLEELGFAERGDLRGFLDTHDLDIAGSLPVNTGGGMLSCGQAGGAGGYLPIVQALRQLAAQAGDTQVREAHSALVTGLGMIDQDGPQSIGAAILSAAAIGGR
ncbi:thiolase family protein [Microbacterium sp. 18062]|uniref:thiolase family protein n=1 Tax=Microbacterium sp. 18062 TaxID=2681410 RepID=UPI001356BE43|nr:thiolase family protein [Microbacterium sp. 18062]